jgi:hypothetical protein
MKRVVEKAAGEQARLYACKLEGVILRKPFHNLSLTYLLRLRLYHYGRPLSSPASAEQYLWLPDSSPWASRDSPDCLSSASRDCGFVPHHQRGLHREEDNTVLAAGRARDDGTNIPVAPEVELCKAMSG